MKYICKYCKKEYDWINGKSKEFCCIKCNKQWKKENYGKEKIHICEFCKKEYKYIIGQGNWSKDKIKNGNAKGRGSVSSSRFCSFECGMNYMMKKVKTTIQTLIKNNKDYYTNINNKHKQTCLERYGVESTSQLKSIQEKIKKTCLEKYNRICSIDLIKSKNTINLHKKEDLNYQLKINNKAKQTKLRKYGNENYNNREKAKKTKLEKYGNENYNNIEKIKQTNLEKYGRTNVGQFGSPENKKALKKKYGCYYVETLEFKEKVNLKIDKIIQLRNNTKRKNNTFNTSKPEEEIYKLLVEKFNKVERQYRSEKYPFNCDFYIFSLNLYIEINFHWTHGKEPYNENNQKCIELIEKWKSKNTKFYDKAIEVYTIRDPLKRKTAKENNLNWIEFFNIEEFYQWYNKE